MKIKKKYLVLILSFFSVLGWTLYLLDDTLSLIIKDFASTGLTIDRVLQLGVLSSVSFLAVRVERFTHLFGKFKNNIITDTSEKVGGLTSKVHAQNKELKTISNDMRDLENRQENTASKIESLWQFIIALIYILAHIANEENKPTYDTE